MSDRTEVQVPNDQGEYPTEPKVKAARLAAFVATLVVGWLLKTLPGLTPVGDLVQGWLAETLLDIFVAAIAFVAAWWAGWKARHVQRPTQGGGPVVPTQGA